MEDKEVRMRQRLGGGFWRIWAKYDKLVPNMRRKKNGGKNFEGLIRQ
jgi:hypothetical protein